MKKPVYFVQTNSVFGSDVKSAYLPYSIGTIAAYSWADERIKSAYSLEKFIFIREDPDKIVAEMKNPYLVGLSCYVWSMEYNKALAQKIKAVYPDCIVVMGGHSISPDAHELRDYGYVDILMHGEGEEPFKELLLALLDGKPLDGVSNISFRNDAGEIVHTEIKVPTDISDYP
ncbi:MAG: cobalamin-dependent protein, partial [Clostridia bacterium]|nr:cobalamin-dependent protein [Clostridia bacterium]